MNTKAREIRDQLVDAIFDDGEGNIEYVDMSCKKFVALIDKLVKLASQDA